WAIGGVPKSGWEIFLQRGSEEPEVPDHGEADQLARVGEVELGLDVLAMRVDSLDAETEALRDLAGREPLADHLQDRDLAIGEDPRGACRRSGASSGDHLLQHVARLLGAEVDLAAQDLPDRRDDLLARIALAEVPHRAGTERPRDVMLPLTHRA